MSPAVFIPRPNAVILCIIAFLLSFDKGVEFIEETFQVAELAIDGGKADVGDLVQGFEVVHDHLAEAHGSHLTREGVDQLVLNLGAERIDVDGAFLAGFHEPVLQFVPVKRLTRAVLFDDEDRHRLNHFVGGKPLSARGAFAPPLDAGVVFHRSAVEHAAVTVAAGRALHR